MKKRTHAASRNSKTGHTPQGVEVSPEINNPLPEADIAASTALWKPVGVFGFLASLAILAAMTSEEGIAFDGALKFQKADAYAVALFSVPLLSLTLTAQCMIGTAYAKAMGHGTKRRVRIPNLVPELKESSLQHRVAILTVIAFILIPSFVLISATQKFLAGKYFYASDPTKGCGVNGEGCKDMGNYLSHFRPEKPLELSDLWNTHFRYQGNKTYIPVIFPAIIVLMAGCSVWILIIYLLWLLRP